GGGGGGTTVVGGGSGSTTGGGGSPGNTSTTGTGGSGGTTNSGGQGTAAVGPGITAITINMGVIYETSGPANEAAFGAGLEVDSRQPYRAMEAEVNKAG